MTTLSTTTATPTAALAAVQDALAAIDTALVQAAIRTAALHDRLSRLGRSAEHREVGRSLRARRLALGLTQHELARRACVSRGLLCEVERGTRTNRETMAHVDRTLTMLEQEA